MKRPLDLRSLLLGALLATVVTFTIGATTNRLTGDEILPVRFRVVDVREPQVEWLHGGKVMAMELAPWYGKISRDSHQWRLKHETQKLTLVTIVRDPGLKIGKDDIIGFKLDQHLKASE